MMTYFSVCYEPDPQNPEVFQPKLLGFSSDPFLAMVELAINDIGGAGEPLPGILYQSDRLPVDFFSVGNKLNIHSKHVGNDFKPIGAKSGGKCIFLYPRMQEVYDQMFDNLASYMQNPLVTEAERMKWNDILRKENGVLLHSAGSKKLPKKSPPSVPIKKPRR